MQKIQLLLLGGFPLIVMGCSEHGHSHNDGSDNHAPSKHDSLN